MVKFAEAEAFGHILKSQRRSLGLSQLKLAELANTTARNISNLETGTITPTRAMVKRLSAALSCDAQGFSELMRSAGFVYDSYIHETVQEYQKDAQMAVDLLLEKHSPYPALALNRRYEIIQINEGFDRAMGFLLEDESAVFPLPISLFDILFGVHPFNQSFVEREKYARFLIQRVQREQLNNVESENLIEELKAKLPHIPEDWWEFDANYQPSPNLRTDLVVRGTRYEAMGVLYSVGSPHDFGGNSIRVVLSYPLNDAAEELFQRWG